MTNGRVEESKKRKGRAKGIPLISTLPPEEKFRVFVNLVIKRVKEDQAKGGLKFTKQPEKKYA